MKSKFLNLDLKDLLKGAIVAVVTALLTGLYELITAGGDLTWLNLKPVLLTSLAALISYLLKNMFTNSDGEILSREKQKYKGSGGSFKTLLLVGMLFFSPVILSAQYLAPRGDPEPAKKVSPWSGFFQPVKNDIFTLKVMEDPVPPSAWIFRPTVEVSAMQLIISDTPGKVFDVSSFQSVGMGISYSHFIEVNGLPYNNYGFSFFALFDAIPRETTSFNISPVAAVNALEILNFGAGYSIGTNKFFLLVGLSYNFK